MRADATGASRTRDVGSEIDLAAEWRSSRFTRLVANVGVFLPGDVFGDPAHTALKMDLGVEFRF
jgi:hypothetical protein